METDRKLKIINTREFEIDGVNYYHGCPVEIKIEARLAKNYGVDVQKLDISVINGQAYAIIEGCISIADAHSFPHSSHVSLFICQDLLRGSDAKDKFGYKYSYMFSIDCNVNTNRLAMTNGVIDIRKLHCSAISHVGKYLGEPKNSVTEQDDLILTHQPKLLL